MSLRSRIKQHLIAPKELAVLAKRSSAKGLRRLFAHILLAVATGFLISFSMHTDWFVPALWLHGVVLVFLFAPLHESIHFTAFRHRWLNTLVANVLGFILILPPRYFKVFHLEHHRYTQRPARDPELFSPKPNTWRAFLMHVSGLPLWRERFNTTFRYAFGRVKETFVFKSDRSKLIVEAQLYVVIYIFLLFTSITAANASLFWYWLLPMLLGQPFLRLFLLAEHTGCEFVPNMLKNSRTTLTNPLVRWLSWNMSFHSEHHAFTVVPFHALPALHNKMKGAIARTAPGYMSVTRELVGNLR